jgi:hypothetical protein
MLVMPLPIVVGCGGSAGGGSTPPPPTTYTIGGTVSGLTGTGLVLQDNGGNNLSVSASGSFTFSTAVDSGAAYSVAVFTQPTDQSCTVTSGSGTASGNVTNVQVSCSNLPPTTYTIGGTVSGLTGTGLVLQDNSGNNLAVSASGSFIFSTAVASGAAYSVTVLTQPTGQSCTVTSGSGTASANVTNVQVSCSNLPPTTYTIGGTVSGLTGTGLVLQDNGGNNLAVSASGSFTFSTAVDNGAAYSVTVLTQPTGQSCTVTSGSGTASANVTNVQVACSNTTYTIGGTISGLTASGLVLGDGSQTVSPVSGATSFAFSTAVASGSSYAVTVKTQPSGETCTVTNGSGTASANVSNVQVTCATTTYTFGGTVSGLTGTGLVLFNGSTGDKLPVSANGSFTFGVTEPSGSSYSVTVLTQPTGQSCTVTNGSGTMSANVTNIQVTCTMTTYTIGGTVSGLTGTGLVLQDNSGNNLAVSASGSFTFSTAVASGSTYSVTVLTQPTGQSCTVTNGSGTASANVSNVQVTCSTTTYTIGGTVSGLTASGLVLADGSQTVSPVSGATSFTFPTAVASSTIYSVTVETQPSGETCTVTNGSGTASANVSNVQVTCSTTTYTIGGTISGLTASGLVLADGSQTVSLVSGATSFAFPTAVASGSSYAVTVKTQPSGETCTVTNGGGTASANVTNVQVACSNVSYSIGGTVSGLTGTGLVLQDNGGNNATVGANGAFTFSNGLASGATYSVTVLTQPTGQSCTVTNGSGTAGANVTNVQVVCSNVSYTIGGTVSGLIGTGLVLQDNSGNNLAVSASGSFTFSTAVASGAAYSVTVLTQPTGQSCTVTNGSGTASANVTNVQITCSLAYYTIGGTVSGLTGTGLVLQNDGGNNLAVSANGAFTFSNPVARGTIYNVTVLTQPSGQSCTVTNGFDTPFGNVTNVLVSCSLAYYTIGGTVSGLTGTGLVLQNDGGNNLAVGAGAGSFTFSTAVASGAAYSVTILTQPAGQSCTVSNGSGTATVNVTNVQVTCVRWAWMGGSSTVGQSGVYGTLGTAASTNVPGAREYAVSWSDASGNLWLFGGGSLNDLWKFDPALGAYGEWTWMGGSSTVGQSGVYGTQGTEASTNVPGARDYAVSWSDASGNLWLFGGYGIDSTGAGGSLNDLWMFDPKLGTYGEWTWMGGSSTVGSNGGQSGVYGTQGTAASTNVPGARNFAVSWSDASGNLWLFGGFGIDSTGKEGDLNDLWMFNPNLGTNGEWTWMDGSSTVPTQYGGNSGVYGTRGIAASTNIPGGRASAVSWSDASGNLWLFGGSGIDSTGAGGFLNDLWMFDPKLGTYGEWTWMGGSSTVGSNGGNSGVYGTQGTVAYTNVPGAREYAVSWRDASGNLWLFGGSGYDSTGKEGDLNDLWMFNPNLGINGEWTWMDGSSTVPTQYGGNSGVYGTRGIAASTNIPGGRASAVSWSDASGNLWLFGGSGYDSTGTEGTLNDLWEYQP